MRETFRDIGQQVVNLTLTGLTTWELRSPGSIRESNGQRMEHEEQQNHHKRMVIGKTETGSKQSGLSARAKANIT